MSNNYYNLMTIDAQELLNHYKDVEKNEDNNYEIRFRYDFSNKTFVENLIIKSIDRFEENALLYQMKKVLKKSDDTAWDENSLLHHILYLDFTEVFNGIKFNANQKESYTKSELSAKSANKNIKLTFLFKENACIEITFRDGEQKTFVPFDKSASMARACRITFVDKDLIDKASDDNLDKRLLLGFDFSSIQMILSQYYAYRGLYLSAAHRIPTDDELVLNEKTVIVIDDDTHYVRQNNTAKKLNLFTEIGRVEQKGIYWKLGDKEKSSIEINPFDGEGLISPEYAHLINKKLGKYGYRGARKPSKDFSNEASTFQVRMPFTKGVLHAVDFNGFISEYISEEKSIWIRDIYGIYRDIRKAKIILTKSMFKCWKWIKFIWKKDHDISAEDDLMKHFFDMMSVYDHTLYVGNTNISLSNVGLTKMNYQFFNTLDMPTEDFDNLVTKNNDRKDNVKELLLNDVEDMSEDVISEEDNAPVWKKVLYKNIAFLDNPKIKSLMKSTNDSLTVNCADGRLSVAGECRFLSCDLSAFLIFLARRLRLNKNEIKEKCKKLDTIYSDRFYMPQSKIKLNPTDYYAVFRSPHLSRNEQVILKPYVAKKETVYDKYLSHLSGVIMLSRNSLAPSTLAGADFDGDLVKIVSEKSIVNAVKRGAYEESDDRKKAVRKLPIIIIPNTKKMAKETTDKGSIPYSVIKDTFSNQIGRISNYAIQIGKKEYFEKDLLYKNRCAECTILTGLEIDAAKTGMHPYYNIDEIRMLLEDDESVKKDDYFLKTSKAIIEASKGKNSIKLKDYKRKIEMKTFDTKWNTFNIKPYKLTDSVPNIDRLPYYYAMEIMNQGSNKKKPQKRKIKFASFIFEENDPEWKKKLDGRLLDETKKLITAYLGVLNKARLVSLNRRRFAKSKYFGCVHTVLKVQYDSLNYKLPCRMSVESAIDSAYTYFDSLFEQTADAQIALTNLIKLNWQFAFKNDREKKLAEILSVDEESIPIEVKELLCNFNNSGYNLLYFIIHDFNSNKLKNLTPELYNERMEIKKAFRSETSKNESFGSDDDKKKKKEEREKSLNDNVYYHKLYPDYYNEANEGKSKKIWQNILIKKCRIILDLLFDKDMDLALQYIVALHSADKNATFFWDILPETTILKNITYHPWKGEDLRAE